MNDEPALFSFIARRIRDLSHFAAHEESPFFKHALIELIVGFVRRAHVNVKVIDRCTRALVDKMRELQSLHAADHRAIIIEILIARPHAMDNAYALRHGLSITQNNISRSRPRRIGQALELQAREHIRQTSIAVIAHASCVEQVIASGKDDIANIDVQHFILLVEIDRARWAEFLASLACAFDKVGAVLLIHHGEVRHGLRERRVHRLAISKPRFVHIVDHFLRALLLTNSAARAKFFVDKTRLLFYRHMEVAHIASHIRHFTPCQQRNVRVCSRLHHAWSENTRGTIQRGESLIELRHVPANGWFTFHQIHMESRIRNFKRRLDSRNAAAHHQSIWIDRNFDLFQRTVLDHSRNRA